MENILLILEKLNIISNQSYILVAFTIFFYFSCGPENKKWDGGFFYNHVIEMFPEQNRSKALVNYRKFFVVTLLLLAGMTGASLLSNFVKLSRIPDLFILTTKVLIGFFNFILPIAIVLFAILAFSSCLDKLFTKLVAQKTGISKNSIKLICFSTTLLSVVAILALYEFINIKGIAVTPVDEDRFSIGEEVFFSQELWEDTQEKCFKVSQLKNSAIESYNKYKKAKDSNPQSSSESLSKAIVSLKEFIEECPADGEARIYYNNYQVLANSDSKPPVKIITSIPMSINNNSPFVSQEILRGVATAQADINRNISDERNPLIVGIADDGFDNNNRPVEEKRMARRVAKYVVKNEPDTLGVIGHFTSDATEAASSIYDSHSMVVISPTSTAVRRSWRNIVSPSIKNPLSLSQYVFRTAPNDREAINKLIDYIKNINKESDSKTSAIRGIGLIYEGRSRYSNLYKQVLEQELGRDNKFDILNPPFRFNDKCGIDARVKNDLKGCLESLQSNGEIDAIVIIPSSESSFYLVPSTDSEDATDQISAAIQDIGFNGFLFGGDAMYHSTLATEERLGMVVPIAIWKDPNQNQINWRTAMSIDATMALIDSYNKVVEKAGNSRSIKSVRKEMRRKLSSETFDGHLGKGTVVFSRGDRDIKKLEQMPTLVCIVEKVKSTKEYEFRELTRDEINSGKCNI